jgi:hypothetical protein
MISYLVHNKGLILNDIIPCQDGFMILKDFYYENILYDCQNEILNNYGINIKLKIKEFDEIIEIGEYDGGLLINDFNFLRTNTDFLEHLYNCDKFSNKIYKEDEKTYYYYNKDTTIFEPTTSQDIRQITSKYVLDLLRDNETMIDSKILQKYENKYGNDMRNILKDYKINKDCHKIFNKLLCFIPIKDNKIIYIGEERCKIYNDETIFESNEIFKKIEGKIYEKNEIFDRTEFFKFNYVSNVNYIEELSIEEYNFCKKYFNDIFCDKTETVKTVLNILKTSMSGIVLKYLFCCVGSKGNNGKSIFFDVMLKGIFGNMIDVLNKSIIIDTGVKSNLNTECEKLDKIKIGYVNEFSDSDIFNNTMIKTITGGDNLNLRTLQTKDNTLKPTCNLFINSNSLPKSAYNLDTALFNRIVIIPFDKTFENDITFKFKLKNKIDALFSYIIQNGKIVYEKLELSEEMKSENNKYKDNNKKNSFLGDFIDENIEIIENERIERDIFYNKYYEWCNEKNIKQNKIPFGTFSKIMNKEHNIKSGHSGLITYYSDIKFKI